MLNKAEIFVKHIENHLKMMDEKEKKHGKVMCKICCKDIDEIYEDYQKEPWKTIEFSDGFWEKWKKADELERLKLVKSLPIWEQEGILKGFGCVSPTLFNSYLTDLYNNMRS